MDDSSFSEGCKAGNEAWVTTAPGSSCPSLHVARTTCQPWCHDSPDSLCLAQPRAAAGAAPHGWVEGLAEPGVWARSCGYALLSRKMGQRHLTQGSGHCPLATPFQAGGLGKRTADFMRPMRKLSRAKSSAHISHGHGQGDEHLDAAV